jgi:hypothetical protein
MTRQRSQRYKLGSQNIASTGTTKGLYESKAVPYEAGRMKQPWAGSQFSSWSQVGEKFVLDIPFYRTDYTDQADECMGTCAGRQEYALFV